MHLLDDRKNRADSFRKIWKSENKHSNLCNSVWLSYKKMYRSGLFIVILMIIHELRRNEAGPDHKHQRPSKWMCPNAPIKPASWIHKRLKKKEETKNNDKRLTMYLIQPVRVFSPYAGSVLDHGATVRWSDDAHAHTTLCSPSDIIEYSYLHSTYVCFSEIVSLPYCMVAFMYMWQRQHVYITIWVRIANIHSHWLHAHMLEFALRPVACCSINNIEGRYCTQPYNGHALVFG